MKYAGPMNPQISGRSSIVSERRFLTFTNRWYYKRVLLNPSNSIDSFESSHRSKKCKINHRTFLCFANRIISIIHNYCKFAVVLIAKREKGRSMAKMRFIFRF